MLLRIAEWLVWRVVSKEYNLITGEDHRALRRLIHSCVVSIPEDVKESQKYQKSEAEILDARLSRRYDPGLALIEATNRAVAAKIDQKGHEIEIRPGEKVIIDTQLTSSQLAALEMQKQRARCTVERSMTLDLTDDGEGYKFSSGNTMYANCGIVGLGPELELTEGYDGGCSVFNINGDWALEEKHKLTRTDLLELSDMMIKRWKKFKERLQVDQIVQNMIPGVKGANDRLRVFYDWKSEEIKLELGDKQYNLFSKNEVLRDNEWKRDFSRRVQVRLRQFLGVR